MLVPSLDHAGWRSQAGPLVRRVHVPAFAAWFGVTPQVTQELRAELERALGG